jgi:hypothetical protein
MLPVESENTIPPDEMMPVQFSDLWYRRPRTAGEKIALAILERAITDLRQYRTVEGTTPRGTRARRAQRLYTDAFRWVYSNDRIYPFSFINVCEILKISPQALRAGVGADERRETARVLTTQAA